MMMYSRGAALFAVGLAAAAVLPAAVQAQTVPSRIRGTIERVDGRTLVVAPREGGTATITLPDPPRVSAVVRKTLADIGPGTFVGVAGMPMPDGSQRAVAVALLPEAARANSFHSAWDLMPESTMTNATVAETVKGVSGDTLKVTYGLAPASVADLKPGTRVVVFAQKTPDGGLAAGNVIVGRDGVDPPM
jgi:hypothetical protein